MLAFEGGTYLAYAIGCVAGCWDGVATGSPGDWAVPFGAGTYLAYMADLAVCEDPMRLDGLLDYRITVKYNKYKYAPACMRPRAPGSAVAKKLAAYESYRYRW